MHSTTNDRTAHIAELRRRFLAGTLDEVLELTDAGLSKLIGDLRSGAQVEKRDRRAA